jgi:hypothetical protein
MAEKFQFYKKDETVVHNLRRYGNWFTYAMLGLGSVLTAIPPTAPVGVGILGGASVDKAGDMSYGKSFEEWYDRRFDKKRNQNRGAVNVYTSKNAVHQPA